MDRHEDVLERVQRALRTNPQLGEARITVTFEGDRLCLSGMVDDAHASDVAVAVAHAVSPEWTIDNALSVASVGPVAQGGDLAQHVAEAFRKALDFLDGPVIGGRFELHSGGCVYLFGHCASLRDRRILSHTVSLVPGVRRVNDEQLGVAMPEGLDDLRLGDRAIAALHVLGLDLAHAVRIHMRDHIAHVHGSVRTEREHRRIITTLERTPGLQAIADHLRAYQKGTPDNLDALLEQTLKRHLGKAHLPVAHIAIFLHDGVVSLLGEVDSPIQHDLATQLALSVPGIKHVDNQLVVTASHGRATRGPREDLPQTKRAESNEP